MDISESVVAQYDVLVGNGHESSTSTDTYKGGLQSGLDRALDKFLDTAAIDNRYSLDLKPPSEIQTPMNLLKERVSTYIEQEHVIEAKMEDMRTEAIERSSNVKEEVYQMHTMLSMQMAYHQKSLNGSLILSTAKSAEGFVKTLMRSQ